MNSRQKRLGFNDAAEFAQNLDRHFEQSGSARP